MSASIPLSQQELSPLFEAYLERMRRKQRHRSTQSGFRIAALRFDHWLGDRGIRPENAGFTDIEEFLHDLPLAATTKELYLAHIGAAFRYAHARGVIAKNPIIDVELPRSPDKEPRIISNDELRQIKARVRTDWGWLIFHLLAYTGMRRGEVFGLRWDDVSLRESTLRVLGKGGKLRLVPIHPALGEVLAEMRPEAGMFVVRGRGAKGVMSTNTQQDVLKCMHGIYTPHDYRRTVATSLKRNGVSENIIDRIMGWAPRAIRDRYYINVADIELQRGILKLYGDDPV